MISSNLRQLAPLIPMLLFGALAGVVTVLIRNIGAYADGVIFAVLLANVAHPLLDKIRHSDR